jgi:hypothetical protein
MTAFQSTILFYVLLFVSIICLILLATKLLKREHFTETSPEWILQNVDPSFGSGGLLIPVVRDGAGMPQAPIMPPQPVPVPIPQPAPPAPAPAAPAPEPAAPAPKPAAPEPAPAKAQPSPSGDGTYTPISASLSLSDQIEEFLKKWPAEEYSKIKPNAKPNIYEVTKFPMAENKARIQKLFTKLGVPENMQLLIIAKGMIETEAMDVKERDISKDPGGNAYCGEGCINFGFANLNTSMIRDILKGSPIPGLTNTEIMADNCAKDKGSDKGPTDSCNPAKSILNQNTDEGYEAVMKLIIAGVNLWGIDRYVDYLRGGGTMFNEPTQANLERFKVKLFKCGMSMIVKLIQEDPKLLTDNRRVSLEIDWV